MVVDIDKLYREWERAGKPNLTYPSLKGLMQWFLRECERKGVDPETIDFEALVDRSLTYSENRLILAEVMATPFTEMEYTRMYEEHKGILQKQAKEKYPEIIEPLEERIATLERAETTSKRRYKKIKELERKLAESERHLEEERAKPPEVAPVKLRILKAFSEGIIDYTVDSVIETRDVDWALDKIGRGFVERVPVEVPVEVVKPPPVKPPPPKVKVLPPVPEKCPIDGTPLQQVERMPIFVPAMRLTSEEEYLRSRTGIPLPTMEMVWIDVPPTMKIWMCREDHYFERDAAGRLVQRTGDFLYRKILRETAKLRRLAYPPPPPVRVPTWEEWERGRVRVEEVWVGPHIPRLEEWLRDEKRMTVKHFEYELANAERENLVREYQEYIARIR